MKVLIVIPTYNERDNVRHLSDLIFKEIPNDLDILFVDDGSPDGTGELLTQMARENPKVKVLHRPGKQGLATAYIQGFEIGLTRNNPAYDWFVEMDADFSHDPKHLHQFIRTMKEGLFEVIVGSRYVEGGGVVNWDRRRLLLSKLGSIYSTFWLAHSIGDWTGGFNAWSRRVVEQIALNTLQSRGYAFQIEMKYRALTLGFAVKEIPIIFQERRAGKSKMSGSIVKEAILGVAKLKWLHSEGRLLKP